MKGDDGQAHFLGNLNVGYFGTLGKPDAEEQTREGGFTHPRLVIDGLGLECTPQLRLPLRNFSIEAHHAATELLKSLVDRSVIAHDEAGEFAGLASAVLVNLGTPADGQRAAMSEAVRAAHAAGTPWVLDPVAAGAVGLRTRFARELLGCGPAVVRGNASEILALSGAVCTALAGRGLSLPRTTGPVGSATCSPMADAAMLPRAVSLRVEPDGEAKKPTAEDGLVIR